MSRGMHKTTVMIPHDLWEFMETWCFEHGVSFASFVRQAAAEKRKQENERQQQYRNQRDPVRY